MKTFILLLLSCTIVLSNDTLALIQDNTKKTLELKSTLYQAKQKAQLDRQMLQDLLVILKSKKATLGQELREFQKANTNAKKIKNDLIAQKLEYQNSIAYITQNLKRLENKLAEVIEALPPVFAKELATPLGNLKRLKPKDLSKRLAGVLGITSRLNAYANGINVFEEAIQIEGQMVQVQTLYLGVSYGYFYNQSKQKAGFVRRKDQAWIYEVADAKHHKSFFKDLQRTFDIKQGLIMADFVELPVKLEER